MPISSTARIPTAFYRGYELGNGLNDWLAVPQGNSPAIPRTTLWATRAIIQAVGSNIYTNIKVDAFRMGIDASPKDFHTWWELFIQNIWANDPNLAVVADGELVFIESKNHDAHLLFSDVASGATSMVLWTITGLVVGSIIIIYNKNQATNRKSDVVKVTGLPGGGVVNFSSIRVGGPGLVNNYVVADAQIYHAEAAWISCFLEAAPDIGPAEENSRGNFRQSIPFSFISNGDRQ